MNKPEWLKLPIRRLLKCTLYKLNCLVNVLTFLIFNRLSFHIYLLFKLASHCQSGVLGVHVGVSIKDRTASSLTWNGTCFKEMSGGSEKRQQKAASITFHFLLTSLRNSAHCTKEIVLHESKTLSFTLSVCGLPDIWICNRSVWALSCETVKVELQKGRLKIDNFLSFWFCSSVSLFPLAHHPNLSAAVPCLS